MQPLTQAKFLQKLAVEAQLQSALHQKELLPQRLWGVGRLMIIYPWQILLILSGLSALVIL